MTQHLQRFTLRRDAVVKDTGLHDASLQESKMRFGRCALLVFVTAALFYGIFVTVAHSGDDLQYASLIQNHITGDIIYYPTGTQPYLSGAQPYAAPLPVNPRYLLEWPTSVLAAKLAYLLGYSGTVIVPIQILRIVVGALGLSVFFLAIAQFGKNIPIAVLATLGLGVTVSFWTYSTHVDQSINAVALLCLALYIFMRQTQTGFTWFGQLLLITVLAFASFYNLTAAISALAFGFGVACLPHQTSASHRVRKLIGFGLVYAAIVAIGVVAAIAIFDSPERILDPSFWREASFAGRPDYAISPIHDAIRSAFGLGRSQILFPGVYGSLNHYVDDAMGTTRLLLAIYYGVVLLLLIAPIVLLVVRRTRLGDKGKVGLFLFVWLASHTLFNWFWDPGYNKYWLIPLVCCWALVALALDHIRTNLTQYFRPVCAALCAFVILTFVVNFTSQFLPDCRKRDNDWLAIATELKTESRPMDLFLSPGHPLDFYVSFFTRRDILASDLVSLASGNDQSSLKSNFKERIMAHRADNGEIYVYGLEPLSESQRAEFLQLLGAGSLRKQWTPPGTTIYRWDSTGRPVA